MTAKTKVLLTLVILLIIGTALFLWSSKNMSNLSSNEVLESVSCGQPDSEMLMISGGELLMGAAGIYPDESPEITVNVGDFMISRYEVTNAEFAQFVSETGYVTVAEQQPDPTLYPNIDPALLKPGSVVFKGLSEAVRAGTLLNWWHFVEGANWKTPYGGDSNIDGLEHFPVVHIAYADAEAYANWKGHRLPTEAEFEFAARGGLVGKKYATGDQFVINGKHQANTWQGVFPFDDSGDDGYVGIAPVGCFEANQYGVHDLIGNVWEWTSDRYYPQHVIASDLPEGLPKQGYDPQQPGVPVGVVKGGSYLCSDDFCARFRPAARHSQDTSLGTSHIGFRTVKDAGL